jgi:hypothetical protein
MAEGLNNTLEYKLDDNEYAYIMSEFPRINSRLNPKQVFIPTLMAYPNRPHYKPQVPEQHVVQLSDSIYCNDKECKPVVSPTVVERNFVYVYHHANDWFHHRWLDRGMRILVDIHNKDMDHIRVIDHEDPSYCDDCTTEHPLCPWEEALYNGIYNPQ